MVGRNGLTSLQFIPSRLHLRRMDTCVWIGQGVLLTLLVGYFIYFKGSGSMWKEIDNKKNI